MKAPGNDPVPGRLAESVFQPFALWIAGLCGIKSGMRVLDVGCGSGSSTFPILDKVGKGGRVEGVDLSEPLISLAADRAKEIGVSNAAFGVGDAEALGFPDQAFDCVLSTFLLMQVKDKAKALGEMKRVLKPGGILGCTVPGLDHYRELRAVSAAVLKEDLFHPRKNCLRTDPDALPALLENAGMAGARFFEKTSTTPVPSVDEYDHLLETRGPKRRILASLPEERREETWEAVRKAFREILGREGALKLTVHGRAAVWKKP